MSSKTNVWAVIIAHCRTLRHHGEGYVSPIDIAVFLVCPLLLAVLIFYSRISLTSALVSALINASAILLGLLLNLLILMFDQRSKAGDLIDKLNLLKPPPEKRLEKLSIRCEVIDQSVANISFTILLCIGSLVSLLLFSIRPDSSDVDVLESIVYALNAFIWSNVSLTILMIIKRVYALFEGSRY